MPDPNAGAAAAAAAAGAGTTPTLEELQAQIATKDAELAAAQEKIKGYADKDFNFKRLREMTEQEKSALSAREMEIVTRQEKLEDEQKSWREAQELAHKNDAMSLLAGGDEELRRKLEFHYNRIADPATTRDQIFSKMSEAAKLAGQNVQSDPFSRAASFSGGMQPPNQTKGLSAEQSDLAARLGISAKDVERAEEVKKNRIN